MAKTPKKDAAVPESFDDEALYVVQLSAAAEYEGTHLVPAHEHTLKGKIAEAIRDKIAHARAV
jgi:hypothetical protein